MVQPAPVVIDGAILAVISTVVPALLMGAGRARVGAQISTIGPVGTVAIAWPVLGERPGALAALACP